MKKLLIVILTTVLTGGTISTSLATVMGFDELTPNYYVASVVANGYGGFDWVNWGVVGKIGGGYSNAPVSGMQSIFNSYSYAATISSEKTFDFNGAYFTSAHYNDNVVTIMGFQGGRPEVPGFDADQHQRSAMAGGQLPGRRQAHLLFVRLSVCHG